MSDPLTQSALGEAELGRQLATLAFAGVRAATGTALQAVVWWNGLLRLGLAPPLVVVHDLGLLLARQKGVAVLDPGEPLPGRAGADAPTLARHRALLQAVAASEARIELEGALARRDEVIVILLARLLGDLYRRWTAGGRG